MPRLIFVGSCLGAIGYFFGLCAWQIVYFRALGAARGGGIIEANAGHWLPVYILFGIALTASSPLLRILRSAAASGSALTGFRQCLRITAPFSMLVLIPPLFDKGGWSANPFLMMGVLAIIGVAVLRLSYRIKFDIFSIARTRPEISKWSTYALLACAVLAYAIYFSYFTILNHYQLNTTAFDLGLYENAIANSQRGEFMKTSYGYTNSLLVEYHFSMIYAIAIPFYRIFPYTETLLILQSIFIALGAVPLFGLARKLTRSYGVALAAAISYLLHPANHGANFYDFHELAFFPFFLIGMFYFLERSRVIAYYLFFVGCILIKEDLGIVLALAGAFIGLSKKRSIYFIPSIVISLAWFFLIQFLFKTGTGESSADRLGWVYGDLLAPGMGLDDLIATCLTNPIAILRRTLSSDKILYFLQLFLPLALLPLLRARNWLLLSYGLAVSMFADRPALHKISFQYVWYTLPLAYVAALYTLRHRMTVDRARRAPSTAKLHRFVFPGASIRAMIAILFCSIVMSWQYGGILNREGFTGGFTAIDFNYTDEDKERLTTLRSLIREIPEGSSVTGSEWIAPHLNGFREVQTFRYFHRPTDYILLFDPNREQSSQYDTLLNSGQYAVVKSIGGFQLLKRFKSSISS